MHIQSTQPCERATSSDVLWSAQANNFELPATDLAQLCSVQFSDPSDQQTCGKLILNANYRRAGALFGENRMVEALPHLWAASSLMPSDPEVGVPAPHARLSISSTITSPVCDCSCLGEAF